MASDFDLRPAAVTDPSVRSLIAAHLAAMQAESPPESVHALGVDALGRPDIALWAAWDEGRVAGIGALARLDDTAGELKSMRVDDAYRGRGVGRLLLRHLMAEARTAGMTSLWLETGSTAAFAPARGLYESEGFAFCGPFGDYHPDPHSVFMTRSV